MKSLLVTGASGFVGWHLCRLAAARWQVVGCAWSQPLAVDRVQTAVVDLTVPEAVEELLARVEPAAVIHAAALSKPDICQQQPERSWAINVAASVHLAQLCAARAIPLVFTSTDLVFDGRRAPYSEQDPVGPVSIYGEHKVQAERQMRACCAHMTLCRLPLMYGRPAPASTGFLTPLVRGLKSGQEQRLFVDEFRTPANVEAVAAGLLLALERAPGRVLHLGGRQRLSRYDFGRLVASALGVPERLILPTHQADVQFPAPRPADVSLDSRAAYALGYDPSDVEADLYSLLKNAQG